MALAAVLFADGAMPAEASARTCSRAEKQLGVCANVSGGSVNLTGTETTPGAPAQFTAPDAPVNPGAPTTGGSTGGTVGGNTGTSTGTTGGGAGGGGWGGIPRPNLTLQDPRCVRPQPNRPAECYTTTPGTPATPGTPGGPGGSTTAIPTITIRDIASFTPTPGRQQMEPDGWTVAGLDTNFYAITDPHVVGGTLLGRAADVRFTPRSFAWNYGDGSTAVKSTKGGPWAALGIREFEPTPTSHVYEQLGDYTITLSITFSAEYRFAGGPWRPVVGTITLPANDLHIRVGEAKTVLVERDCLTAPSGPGC